MSSPLDFFVSRGWTREQSAGIVGNLYGESRLDPRAVGDGGLAYGVAQWHPDRQANFAKVYGFDIRQATQAQQLGFVDWELRNTEKRAGNLLRGTTNVRDATNVFMRAYERPADGSSFGNRLAAAGKALGGEALNGAKNLLLGSVDDMANMILPGSGMLLNAIGIGESCGIICQIKEWIKESGFFQRIAMALLAFIVVLAAFYLMKGNDIIQQVRKVTK